MSGRWLFDIETNGLLWEQGARGIFCMDRVHCLWMQNVDTGEIRDFYKHGRRDTLREGLEILSKAEWLIGHNIIDFDLPALEFVYPGWSHDARIYDTLVMARMVFADVKEHDFRRVAKGQLEGRYIGQQGLEAWGQRLGEAKGDYAKERAQDLKDRHKELRLPPPTPEQIHAHVWGTWNRPMHDYCGQDIAVNAILFHQIEERKWSHEATVMEHRIHDLMVTQERNGFLFDREGGEKLSEHLRGAYSKLEEKAIDAIGRWFRPDKIVTDTPRLQYGEDVDRRTWGDVTIPKKTINRHPSRLKLKQAAAEADPEEAARLLSKMNPDTVEGCPFVKVHLKEFNPNSRPQIIDRLKVLHGWEPQDFTETGTPKVDDEILRNLSKDVPLAETLAELFFLGKRLGQVATGKNGWLKLIREDGCIHGRVNVGGTVSGRATHSTPNVSQVPGVTAKEFKDYAEGKAYVERVQHLEDHRGRPLLVDAKWKEKKGEWSILVRGRDGDYGWDCRELFIVRDGFKLVGCDLSGIEFRCLAELTAQYDDGELIEVVLNGDIHQKNADLVSISRSVAKRLLYATMYGGGDAKLGSIVEPFASEARQKTVGKQLRDKLMRAMPSLARAIKGIKREMRRNNGTIQGLDGRRLYARSPHSALNLRLQSDGALIAKKWALLIDDHFQDEGWDHHPEGDYAFCSWSHDELQVAVRAPLAPRAAEIMEAAAAEAGEHFNFRCPVAAEAKIGTNWAQTH